MRRASLAAALLASAPVAAQSLLLGVGPGPLGSISGPFINSATVALGSGLGGVYDAPTYNPAEGWTVTCPSCTSSGTAGTYVPYSGQTFNVVRGGYASIVGGVPVWSSNAYTDTFTVTAQLRKAYYTGYPISPPWPLNTNNLWALSDTVLASDQPSGFTNNSTLTAPAPVCNWTQVPRLMVGRYLKVAFACFSGYARNNSQIYAAVATASDGLGNTASTTITSMTASHGGDPTLDLTFAGSVSGTTLTVTAPPATVGIAPGMPVIGPQMAPNTTIASVIDATHYTLSRSQATIGPETLTLEQTIVYDYEGVIDLGDATHGLTDKHDLKLDVDAYPFIGSAGGVSVEHTTNHTSQREFSTRWYFKDFDRAPTTMGGLSGNGNGNGYVVFVNPSTTVGQGSCASAGSDTVGTGGRWFKGNASTGVGSIASCFATIGGAMNAVKNATYGIPAETGTGSATPLPIGAMDGTTIYITGTTPVTIPSTGNPSQYLAAMTITRDPYVTRAAALLTGTSSARMSLGYTSNTPTIVLDSHLPLASNGSPEGAIILKDLTVQRTSTSALFGTPGGTFPVIATILSNVTLDNNSQNGLIVNATSQFYAYDVLTLNNSLTTYQATGSAGYSELRALRSVTMSSGNVNSWYNIGGIYSDMRTGAGIGNDDGAIFAFMYTPNNAVGTIGWNTISTIARGLAVVQNASEITDNLGTHVWLAEGSDSGGTYNISNVIMSYNTWTGTGGTAGSGSGGRIFWGYNENNSGNGTTDINRNYRFWTSIGNLISTKVQKQDLFDGQNGDRGRTGVDAAQNRTGGWAVDYGVSHWGDLIEYNNIAEAVNFFGDWYGLNAQRLPDPADPLQRLDPKFVFDGGSTQKTAIVGGISGATMTLASAPTTTLANGTEITGSGVLPNTTVTGSTSSTVYTVTPAGQSVAAGTTLTQVGTIIAGPGGSDQHLQAGSPCLGNVPAAHVGLPGGLGGDPRPTSGNDRCGAW